MKVEGQFLFNDTQHIWSANKTHPYPMYKEGHGFI